MLANKLTGGAPAHSEKAIPIQNGKGFLKADVFIYMHNGEPVICKDYSRYQGSWRSLLARILIRREARILDHLKDWPHSPKVVGCLGGLALMMEYIPGDLLSDHAGSADPFYFSQLMAVMRSLHGMSITHNDVRGNNIILSQGRVVLIDFAAAVRGRGLGRLLLSPMRRSDMSHLVKYKVKMTGEAPTPEEQRLYQKPRWITGLQQVWKKRLLPFFKKHIG